MSVPPQHSLWAQKVARLVEAEGKKDPDLLRQHTAHLRLEEAASILQEGEDIKRLVLAAAKVAKASAIAPTSFDVGASYQLLWDASKRASAWGNDVQADAARVFAGSQECSEVAGFVMGVALSFTARRARRLDAARQVAAKVAAHPERTDACLRQLGADLTAGELETLCLETMQHDCLERGDPLARQVAHRMRELDPGPAGSLSVAVAEGAAGNLRACYEASLRGVVAARQQGSFLWLFNLSCQAAGAITLGALGPTYTWSQVAPFLANMREAVPHLRCWMPGVQMETELQPAIDRWEEMERTMAATPKKAIKTRPDLMGCVRREGESWRCCAACGKEAVQMLKCGACKVVFYCNADCQKSHWQQHKKECKPAAGAEAAAAGSSRGAGGQ